MPAESYEAEPSEFELSPALLAALKPKNGVQPTDLHVEGWKPSLLGRIAALFGQQPR